MKILIVSDTWEGQVNGVERTLRANIAQLEQLGNEVTFVHSGLFKSMPCPLYPEVRLAIGVRQKHVRAILEGIGPCCIHIVTEGPVGLAFRNYCVKHDIPYTTAYLSKFPEHLWENAWIPTWLTFPLYRWFHKHSQCVMVATQTMREHLREHGFKNEIRIWKKGCDVETFRPMPREERKRPVLMYVGRVSKEKNLEAFLGCRNEGVKVVVGDGPYRAALQKRYPDVEFWGYLHGEDLAAAYSEADVFVFPSVTETFGLVMVEAMACGTPTAAYPVCGPIDIVTKPELGCLDWNLEVAIDKALNFGDRKKCREHALNYSWRNAALSLLANMEC